MKVCGSGERNEKKEDILSWETFGESTHKIWELKKYLQGAANNIFRAKYWIVSNKCLHCLSSFCCKCVVFRAKLIFFQLSNYVYYKRLGDVDMRSFWAEHKSSATINSFIIAFRFKKLLQNIKKVHMSH